MLTAERRNRDRRCTFSGWPRFRAAVVIAGRDVNRGLRELVGTKRVQNFGINRRVSPEDFLELGLGEGEEAVPKQFLYKPRRDLISRSTRRRRRSCARLA